MTEDLAIPKRHNRRVAVAAVICTVIVAGVWVAMSANTLINAAIRWDTARAMSEYQAYPPEDTAILLVDPQTAHLKDDSALTNRLQSLLSFARSQNFKVVYSTYDPAAVVRFPTPAHKRLLTDLNQDDTAATVPLKLSPTDDDLVLPPRSTLSVLANSDRISELQKSGTKRLVLAGPLTTVSVDSTLRDAVQYDSHVTVLSDCIGSKESAHNRKTIELTFPRYAHSIITLSEFRSVALQTDNNNEGSP